MVTVKAKSKEDNPIKQLALIQKYVLIFAALLLGLIVLIHHNNNNGYKTTNTPIRKNSNTVIQSGGDSGSSSSSNNMGMPSTSSIDTSAGAGATTTGKTFTKTSSAIGIQEIAQAETKATQTTAPPVTYTSTTTSTTSSTTTSTTATATNTFQTEQKQRAKTNTQGFHLCRLQPRDTGIAHVPVLGGEPLAVSYEFSPLPIRFQCAGSEYYAHATKLEHLLKTLDENKSIKGKRTLPIPPKTSTTATTGEPARTSVLVMGSSQLRQIITALTCQYADQVVKVQPIWRSTKGSLSSFCVKVIMEHNIHLWLVINPPLLYSRHWQRLLEERILQQSLKQMDLIILGSFHRYSRRIGQSMLDFLEDHEGSENIDLVTTNDSEQDEEKKMVAQEAPSFQEVVQVFEGPIIYVSPFAQHGNKTLWQVQKTIDAFKTGTEPPPDRPQKQHVIEEPLLSAAHQKQGLGLSKEAESRFTTQAKPPKRKLRRQLLPATPITTATPSKRTNLLAIDSRKYVSKIGECSTESFRTVSTCSTTRHKSLAATSNGHRCFGSRGGTADLTAWDIIEAMYKLLRKSSSN